MWSIAFVALLLLSTAECERWGEAGEHDWRPTVVKQYDSALSEKERAKLDLQTQVEELLEEQRRWAEALFQEAHDELIGEVDFKTSIALYPRKIAFERYDQTKICGVSDVSIGTWSTRDEPTFKERIYAYLSAEREKLIRNRPVDLVDVRTLVVKCALVRCPDTDAQLYCEVLKTLFMKREEYHVLFPLKVEGRFVIPDPHFAAIDGFDSPDGKLWKLCLVSATKSDECVAPPPTSQESLALYRGSFKYIAQPTHEKRKKLATVVWSGMDLWSSVKRIFGFE